MGSVRGMVVWWFIGTQGAHLPMRIARKLTAVSLSLDRICEA
jgi:hypothetical protein